MATIDQSSSSGRGLGRLVPGSVGVAYGDRRPQWAWSMATVGLSGRGLGRMSSNHVPELYFGLERRTCLFTLLPPC